MSGNPMQSAPETTVQNGIQCIAKFLIRHRVPYILTQRTWNPRVARGLFVRCCSFGNGSKQGYTELCNSLLSCGLLEIDDSHSSSQHQRLLSLVEFKTVIQPPKKSDALQVVNTAACTGSRITEEATRSRQTAPVS